MTKPTLPIRQAQGKQGKKQCKRCGSKDHDYMSLNCPKMSWGNGKPYPHNYRIDKKGNWIWTKSGKPEAGWRIRLQKEFFPKHEGDHMDGQYWYIDEDGGGVGQMHKKIKQFIAKQMEKARKEERKWIADKYFGDPQLWWEVKAREELLEDNL